MPRRKRRKVSPRVPVLPPYNSTHLAFGTKAHEDYVHALTQIFPMLDTLPKGLRQEIHQRDISYDDLIQLLLKLGY